MDRQEFPKIVLPRREDSRPCIGRMLSPVERERETKWMARLRRGQSTC